MKFHWRPKLGTAVDLLGRGGEDRRRRPGLSTAATCSRPSTRATSRNGSSASSSSTRTFADALPFDMLDATKLIPEEMVPVEIDRPDGARPQPRQLLRRDRAGRLPADQHPARHRLLATTRCCRAGCSPISTRRSRGSARPTSTRSRSTRRSCPFQNFQRDGQMQTLVPKGRANYEPNSLAEAGEDGGPRESPRRRLRARSPERRARRSGREAAPARRELRRPLQPGAAVLPLADRDRAGAPRLRAGVRAVQGGARARPQAHARPTCATSTRDLAKRVADGLAMPLPPQGEPAARRRSTWSRRRRCRSCKNAKPRWRAARSASCSPTARTRRQIDAREEGVRGAPAARSMLVAPKVGGLKLKGGTLEGRRPARRHALGAVRRGRARPAGEQAQDCLRRTARRCSWSWTPSATCKTIGHMPREQGRHARQGRHRAGRGRVPERAVSASIAPEAPLGSRAQGANAGISLLFAINLRNGTPPRAFDAYYPQIKGHFS